MSFKTKVFTIRWFALLGAFCILSLYFNVIVGAREELAYIAASCGTILIRWLTLDAIKILYLIGKDKEEAE